MIDLMLQGFALKDSLIGFVVGVRESGGSIFNILVRSRSVRVLFIIIIIIILPTELLSSYGIPSILQGKTLR